MNGSSISTVLTVFEPMLCLATLLCVLGRKCGAEYKMFCILLSCHVLSATIFVPLLLFGGHGIDLHLAYQAYFWTYWTDFAIEAVLSLLVIYSVFNLSMAPLHGIKRLGLLVFRSAGCMSLAVVSGSIMLPHASEKTFVLNLITELQRTSSVLTLCMLLFVCLAVHSLGLSYKSRIFGIVLGLGIIATTKLVVFGWMAQSKQLYSFAGVVDSLLSCTAFLIWIAYFVAPEAKRRIVVLPTTSPFLRWNQLSEALGASPGFVAVGGIPPELFAPAELEVMRRASLKMMDYTAAKTASAESLLHQSWTA